MKSEEQEHEGMYMVTQYCKFVKMLGTDVKPAQFIYDMEDTDLIIGFISAVNHATFDVIFFEPTELTNLYSISMSGAVSWEFIHTHLQAALTANPEMYPYWGTHYGIYSFDGSHEKDAYIDEDFDEDE